MENLKFSTALILRSPLYSFCNYTPEKLKDFLTDPYFIIGVYLASPELYKILENANYNISNLNKSQQLSLAKYLNRMHYRPTPFGGFSTFSITKWGQDNHISLTGLNNLKFYTDWDHEVIIKLCLAHTNEKWKEELLYLNHTLYEIKDEYRYVRTHFNFDTKTVSFSLEACYADPLIKEVLSLVIPSKPGQQLLDILCEQLDFRPHEAHDYVHFLLETQLLLSGSHLHVLGSPKMPRSILNKPDLDLPDLEKVKTAQSNLDLIFKQKHLIAAQYTFYTNTKRQATGCLDTAFQNQLSSSLNVLCKMQPVQLPSALKLFIETFTDRYDLEEVPLLKALDPETGIDYANLAIKKNANELLADLDFSTEKPKSDNINWLAMHKLLLRKWNINQAGIPEIILDLNEPEILEQNNTAVNLPPSIAIMFRILGDQILLESAGGVTACSLIGRFANFDPEVKEIAREIITAEQATNPDVLFAEIGQLSGMHLDNINKRPHLYDYEIPVNTISSLPTENQVHLSDLYLSVKQNRLIITSRKLGKEIIPRLTSAYNYTNCDLALFRFLCDIQYQGLQSNLGFNIESFFPNLSSYPRVKLGNVIISPAKWFLNEYEVQKINQSISGFNEVRTQKNWPQYIALTLHDQQLVFNLSDTANISLLQSCIQKLKTIQIQEFFLPDEQTVTENNEQAVINQFIAFFINTKPSYHFPLPIVDNNPRCIERHFSLGSEWLYLKIYCHEHSSNNILSDTLFHLLQSFEPHIIKKWFYVRYTDPKPHIRLRIQADTGHLGLIIKKLHQCLEHNIKLNIIKAYQADTYRREIERYGQLLIEEVENVFYYSSELVCQYIKQLSAVPTSFNYYSLALISTYDMICLFSDFIGDEVLYTSTIAKSLYQEFSTDKGLQVSLDQKYRIMKPEIELLLKDDQFYQQLKLYKEMDHFSNACLTLKHQALNISNEQKVSLVADIIHMHLNRIFFEQQRKQELCIYYMLQKYFTSQKAMAGKALKHSY